MVGNYYVNEYISPSEMDARIEMLSNKVSLKKYDAVLVNMNGGKFLFDKISRLQGYEKDPVLIEYHRPPEGYGAKVVIPVPPEFMDKNALVIDDIYDSGGVLSAIMKDVGPESQALALITKNGIPNQIQIPNILIGMKIDSKWIGGCGMDLGVDGEKNVFRDHPGIVVKITGW